MLKDLVYKALDADPKCRTDDAYLISYIWANGDKNKIVPIYSFLVNKESPKTIYRRKLDWEQGNPALALRGESTDSLKKSIKGQDMLPMFDELDKAVERVHNDMEYLRLKYGDPSIDEAEHRCDDR